jgi:hypothetical protein
MERMRLGGGYLPAFPSQTNQAQHRAEGIEALLPQPRTPPNRGGNESERGRERERERTRESVTARARAREMWAGRGGDGGGEVAGSGLRFRRQKAGANGVRWRW